MGQNTWKGNNGQNILKFGKKQPDKPMFTGLWHSLNLKENKNKENHSLAHHWPMLYNKNIMWNMNAGHMHSLKLSSSQVKYKQKQKI